MIELKVQCDCGQKYKFDVEPVHGRMPYAVSCPVCGADGTGKANALLAQQLPAAASVPIGMAPPVAAPALAPVAMAAAPAGSPPGLRIAQHAPAPAPVPVVATAAPVVPRPMAMPGRPAAPAAAMPAQPGKQPSFLLGVLGAVIGATVGSLIYFLIFKYTGLRLKLLAIGVGYLAGLGAELLGRKEGSKELGLIAASLTLACVVGAQYLVAHDWWKEGDHANAKAAATTYEQKVAAAKKILASMPHESDQEIRIYLASQELEPGEKPDPGSVDAEDIQTFRETELKEVHDLASGKITREQFNTAQKEAQDEAKKDEVDGEGTFKAVFLLLFLSKANLLSLAAAAGLAFKVCSNA
jgi:hypothetical protein